jgi:hypothetical protein
MYGLDLGRSRITGLAVGAVRNLGELFSLSW